MSDISEKAPDLTGHVSTLRLYCTHNNSPAMDVKGQFDTEIGAFIPMVSATLIADDGTHNLGFVFNEDTDTPFAIVYDFNGEIKVCWNFNSENNFDTAELEFETGLCAVEYLLYAMRVKYSL